MPKRNLIVFVACFQICPKRLRIICQKLDILCSIMTKSDESETFWNRLFLIPNQKILNKKVNFFLQIDWYIDRMLNLVFIFCCVVNRVIIRKVGCIRRNLVKQRYKSFDNTYQGLGHQYILWIFGQVPSGMRRVLLDQRERERMAIVCQVTPRRHDITNCEKPARKHRCRNDFLLGLKAYFVTHTHTCSNLSPFFRSPITIGVDRCTRRQYTARWLTSANGERENTDR